MIEAYTQTSVVNREDLADCETGLAKIVSARVNSEEGTLYMKLEEQQTGKLKWKKYFFNTGRNSQKYRFNITEPDVFLSLIEQLGVNYNPYRDDDKYIIQLVGKEVLTYKNEGLVVGVQPVKLEYSNAELALETSRKKGVTSGDLHAYRVYDCVGGGSWCGFEIASRNDVLNGAEDNYKVFALQINNTRYNRERSELKITLEKIGRGSTYEVTFLSEDIIGGFLWDSAVQCHDQSFHRRLIGLFNAQDSLKWLIPYRTNMTKDDVNVTKIDAGDLSFLKKPTEKCAA